MPTLPQQINRAAEAMYLFDLRYAESDVIHSFDNLSPDGKVRYLQCAIEVIAAMEDDEPQSQPFDQDEVWAPLASVSKGPWS